MCKLHLHSRKKSSGLEERCRYYGELLVLRAQDLGLNPCWAALTHGKGKTVLLNGETEVILIDLGYGQKHGGFRKSRHTSDVSNHFLDFWNGVEASFLAPAAVNQQKSRFTLLDGIKVSATPGHFGPCLNIDLGIAKCHFELGAGKENFEWV